MISPEYLKQYDINEYKKGDKYLHNEKFKEAEKEFFETGDVKILWTKAFYPCYHCLYNKFKKKKGIYDEIYDDILGVIIEFFDTLVKKYKRGEKQETRYLNSLLGYYILKTSDKETGMRKRGELVELNEAMTKYNI